MPNVSFVDEDSSVRYLLELDPYNGYEYVDLGLPSGLKWATCNVGASSPEQAGLYFAWGETTGYTREQVISGVRSFSRSVYKSGPAASISSQNLTLEQDAAHINLGGNWRMPASNEFQELLNNCNAVWTNDYNGTGVAGRVFTSKVNGNSVFFPAVGSCSNSSVDGVGSEGCYWLSTYTSSSWSYRFEFNSSKQDLYDTTRHYGFSVRGVCE